MPMLDRGDLSIYFEVHGSGPTVLLTHGFSGSTQTWRGQIGPLCEHYQVVVWDIRGHGQSDAPADMSLYTRDKTLDDMKALLAHVGAGAAHIGGHSLGGYLSIELHRRHPELFQSLLLFNTGPGFKKDEAREAWNAQCVKDAEKFEVRHGDRMAQAPEDRRAIQHLSLMGVARAARGILPQDDGLVIQSLPSIAVPTLIVIGDEDKAFLNAAEYMNLKIPNTTYVMVEGAGHNAMIDQPDVVTDALMAFLAGV